MPAPLGPEEVRRQLADLVQRGRALEGEGLPFPSASLETGIGTALSYGSVEQAVTLLRRGEALYTVAARDWGWVRETLARADELRRLAVEVGLDLQHLDSRVGDPREQLKAETLSAASLGRAGASASLAVAVLSDALPKLCVQEAQKLGETIRSARNRGEDVRDVVSRFSKLLLAVQDHQLVQGARLLVEVRRAVARIPRAPTVALPSEEEEEILIEARNLARRIQKIKSRARNAQGAARLMTQVRAALSEERRTGSPEEEIEALWSEVDRLTKERAGGSPESEAGVASPFGTVDDPGLPDDGPGADGTDAPDGSSADVLAPSRRDRLRR